MPSERNDAPSRTDRCRECDRAVTPGANFCPGCGADLRAAESRDDASAAYCTECGEPVAPAAEFCANCGTRCGRAEPRQPAPDPTADSDARREFRVRVRDHLDDGWELTEDHGDRVVLVARDIGSIPAHVLLLLTTGGVGNLLYGWYNYAELAETRRLSVVRRPAPGRRTGGARRRTRSSPSPATSWAAFSCWSGSGSPPSRSGGERASARCSGSRSPRSGWRCLRPLSGGSTADTASRFGRIRTVDHRITPSTERTEAPCVVCGEAFERGVVRRRRDETVVAGVPIRTPLAAGATTTAPAAPARSCSAATPPRRRSIRMSASTTPSSTTPNSTTPSSDGTRRRERERERER